jgi:DNA helicase-2/ATP-dependent DNA helicase PcrA
MWSEFQNDIFNWIESGEKNGIVGAVAGSGKSTTLIEAAKRIKEGSIIFLAFNTHIVKELDSKLAGTRASARTIHSMGNGALREYLGKVANLDSVESKKKYDRLASAWVDSNGTKFAPDERKEIAASLTKLVNFARMTLVDAKSHKALQLMCIHFDIEINYPSFLFPAVSVILQQGQEQARSRKIIDFTDMLYLPVVWNLPLPKFDFVLCDEVQDLSACQLALVKKMVSPTGRFLGVGDRSQSIFGFAGAAADSFDNIKSGMNAAELPLSICYRCPSSHIALAQMIVPQIQARPGAPEGEVVHLKPADDLSKLVRGGDLIICRLTAPLITECIRLIKNQIAAKVRGRNIGEGLVNLLKRIAKVEDFAYSNVVRHLQEYKARQIEFLRQEEADESAIESLSDRVECLQVCAESYLNAKSIDELAKEIEGLFDDSRPAVWLSTVHRAKGLEADRVFILKPEKLPLRWKNQQAWQYEQELNIAYVALTRAKQSLFIVGELPEPCQAKEDVQPELEAIEASKDAAELVGPEAASEPVEVPLLPAGYDACYSCGGSLQSLVEQDEGVCDFCAGWKYNALPPESATPQVQSQAVNPAASAEIEALIAKLDELVHNSCAAYMQDTIRMAVEDLAELWGQSKSINQTEKEPTQ